MKLLAWLVGIAALALASFYLLGYRFHFDHIHYYLKQTSDDSLQLIRFKSGETLKGTVLEKTPVSIKVNVDGASLSFSTSEIETIEAAEKDSFLSTLQKNNKIHRNLHPLITHQNGVSLTEKIDHAIMEPSRIGEQISKNNPVMGSGPNPAAYLAQARGTAGRISSQNRKAEAEVNAMN